MAFDSKGNLYIADGLNNLVRKITPAGLVSTFAGSGAQGKADGTGTAASFNNLTDVTVDSQDNLYVADHTNGLIRKITPGGTVTTYAGGGSDDTDNATLTTVYFGGPYGVVTDKQGNLYVASGFGGRIKILNPNGTVRNLAGTGTCGYADGIGTQAQFLPPCCISFGYT